MLFLAGTISTPGQYFIGLLAFGGLYALTLWLSRPVN